MALLTINHHSNVLEKHRQFQVILPEGKAQYDVKEDVPLIQSVLLLHGLSNDETLYTRYTNIERFANDAHVAVIIPSVGKSFYTNMAHGHRFYDYVLEVHDYAHQILPLSKDRKDNFVTGHSMGGYGTIKMAFTQSDRFQKACFMSSVTNFQNVLEQNWFEFPKSAIVGEEQNVKNTPFDLKYLVEYALTRAYRIPELYMMCGTEDILYEDNLRFKSYLESKNIPFEYEEGPGDHDWKYWNAGIEKAIQWFIK